MQTRYDGCAATEKGVLVGLRVESGVAVQFHTVRIPWDDLMQGEFGKHLDRAYRRALAAAWEDDRVTALF